MTIKKAVLQMNKINATNDKSTKKTSARKKWREIEDLRNRYALMRELQEDDHLLELEIDDLLI